jgi:hydroxyacylglutathione hydrolase
VFFRQRAAANATLSYFFGCAGLQKAIAVDVVAGDEDWVVAEAERAGVSIAYVIDTHVHADHYSGGLALAHRVGAPYCIHESNTGRAEFAFMPLVDGQRLEVGNVLVDVMHASRAFWLVAYPSQGHEIDSIVIEIGNPASAW